MRQVAAPAHRWTAKILAYPCFDPPFAEALLGARLCSRWRLALQACSLPQLSSGRQNARWPHARFSLRDHICLSSSGSLLRPPKLSFSESLRYQMGFAEDARTYLDNEMLNRSPSSNMVRACSRSSCTSSLVLAPKAKASLNAAAASSSSTPLLDQDNAEKQKWAKRLRSIADRKGDHAKPPAPVRMRSCHQRCGLVCSFGPLPQPWRSTFGSFLLRSSTHGRTGQIRGLQYPIRSHHSGQDPQVCHGARRSRLRPNGHSLFANGSSMGGSSDEYRDAIDLHCSANSSREGDLHSKGGNHSTSLKAPEPFRRLVMAMERYVTNEDHPKPARVLIWWTL